MRSTVAAIGREFRNHTELPEPPARQEGKTPIPTSRGFLAGGEKSFYNYRQIVENRRARWSSTASSDPRRPAVNILIATSEIAPFAKTGGLADVCGSLPQALRELGVNVSLIMPAFRSALHSGATIESTGLQFDIPIGGSKIVSGELLKTQLPDSDVPVYLVAQGDYFDRPELYGEDGQDYADNCERFVFFSRAVMDSIRLLELPVDVMHCNDWQSGLIPAYLNIEYQGARGYENIASLLTIHNMAYQGSFWHWDMLLTGLDWRYFNWRQMECWGQLNFLETGLVFCDSINTVSPRYAEEIQESPLGCGLDGVLSERSAVVTGIINGVHYTDWSPRTDPFLAAQFDEQDWRQGKPQCKAALQQEAGLPVRSDTPLIGLVGRLADQKGWDLVAQVMQWWLPSEDVQWVVLGTGDPSYHDLLSQLANDWPEKMSAMLTFSNDLAHRIEAGSDMFLMPSRYEPCGLNQLYSLKYGTPPIVRETGGLADTIVDATVGGDRANGFTFHDYRGEELERTLRRACDLWRGDPQAWGRLVDAGMRQDWSWGQSARQYEQLYRETVERRASLQTRSHST